MKRILHVDLDAFFASVEQAIEPSLKGRPVIVGRGVVASASYEARADGVKTAMPIREAVKLCPQAVLRDGDYYTYNRYTASLYELLLSYSPAVEMGSLDEAYVDLTGCQRLWGPADGIARQVWQHIPQRLGITASVGLASNKVVAHVASKLKKPWGLVIVPDGKEREFLAPLPIEKLPGVGSSYQRTLREYGISTIGELSELPLILLVATFGEVAGRLLFARSKGLDERPIPTMSGCPPKSISRETTFEEGSADPHFLYSILEYLCERVGAALRKIEKECRYLTVKIRYTDFMGGAGGKSLPRATSDDRELYIEARRLFDRLYMRKVALRHIGVAATSFADCSWQEELYRRTVGRRRQLNQGIDKIRDRYGFSSISYGSTLFLRKFYAAKSEGLILSTPCLSR